MIKEIAHVARHAPRVLAMKRRMPQADFYDTLIGEADAAGFSERRARMVGDLAGHVVEIGCGTGAMFSHYRDGVRVTAFEPDADFAARARARATPAIDVRDGTAESIPLPDGAADAAVSALVLCSVRSVADAARELARVVRPGGRLRLLEHVRSERRVVGALMRAFDPVWLRLNGQGCHLDRDPLPALDRAGFALDRVESFQLWTPSLPAFPLRLVFATRR